MSGGAILAHLERWFRCNMTLSRRPPFLRRTQLESVSDGDAHVSINPCRTPRAMRKNTVRPNLSCRRTTRIAKIDTLFVVQVYSRGGFQIGEDGSVESESRASIRIAAALHESMLSSRRTQDAISHGDLYPCSPIHLNVVLRRARK